MSRSITDLRTKDTASLQALLTEKRDALRKARFEISAGELKNVRSARVLRKDIARILSLLSQSKPA